MAPGLWSFLNHRGTEARRHPGTHRAPTSLRALMWSHEPIPIPHPNKSVSLLSPCFPCFRGSPLLFFTEEPQRARRRRLGLRRPSRSVYVVAMGRDPNASPQKSSSLPPCLCGSQLQLQLLSQAPGISHVL